jgi:hypothetical protein
MLASERGVGKGGKERVPKRGGGGERRERVCVLCVCVRERESLREGGREEERNFVLTGP